MSAYFYPSRAGVPMFKRPHDDVPESGAKLNDANKHYYGRLAAQGAGVIGEKTDKVAVVTTKAAPKPAAEKRGE